jgi:hypothetical protein
MPVTIQKAKVKAKPEKVLPKIEGPVEPEKLSLEALADEYGRLEDELAVLEADPRYTQFKLVAAELKKRIAADYVPQDLIEIKGEHWLLEVGAAAKAPRQIIDPVKVQDFVGAATFAQMVTVPVGEAEKYLTPEQLAQVVSTPGYTTNRKIVSKYLGG